MDKHNITAPHPLNGAARNFLVGWIYQEITTNGSCTVEAWNLGVKEAEKFGKMWDDAAKGTLLEGIR